MEKILAVERYLQRPFSRKSNSEIFKNCISPIITYGNQTMLITKKEFGRLSITQNLTERLMLKLQKKKKNQNNRLNKFRPDPSSKIKK